MEKQIFRKEHDKLMIKYDAVFTDNCDAWFMVSGRIYNTYEPKDNGKFICHIQGMGYNEQGEIEHHPDYLNFLEKKLIEFKKKQNPANKPEGNQK